MPDETVPGDIPTAPVPGDVPTAPVPGDIPEAAGRRVGTGPFTCGLSVRDFAATLDLGIEPLDVVQGFCAVQWTWSTMLGVNVFPGVSPQQRSDMYVRQWNCPHGFVGSDHRLWGANLEQDQLEAAWANGFATAFDRMLEEARHTGAHGVIGVIDATRRMEDLQILEVHLLGTAVRVRDAPPPDGTNVWSTYLAGQRLTKLIEAGWMPIAVVAALGAVYIYESCVTERQLRWGAGYAPDGEIVQLADARSAAVDIAEARIRRQLETDELHGAAVTVQAGHPTVECSLRGTRVRRFKDFDPLAPPTPTVRLT